MTTPKVCIAPRFEGADKGDGGIRRVVEAQYKWLPKLGWDIVSTPEEADLVAVHAGLTATIPATKPLVSHCHGLYWQGYSWHRWALKMNRDVIRSMRRADVVTAPSKWVAHAIARGTWREAPVLYHGVDLEDWSPPESEHGGYVLWNKTRYDAICDPAPVGELAKRAKDVMFVTTSDVGLAALDNIKVSGVVGHDVAKGYVRYAGVYLATARETFGIGTLEAMACGVPVLGWDWGGQAEIITHGVDGWLAKPDNYDDLVEGLRWCIENRERVGREAREKVYREFTWEIAMQRYDTLYRSLLVPHNGPTVSVVIPAYNMQDMLPDAVNSVLEQDYRDFEVVIVDDASTDNTAEVAESFVGDGRVRVIHNRTNQYLAEALNVGITAARGRYIIPLDSDNMLGNGALRSLATALDADRDIDIAYGAMSVIEPPEQKREEWTSPWPQEFQFRSQLVHRNQIPSSSMYRKRAWERVGGYRRRCRTAEDADFWCRATSFGADAKRVTGAVVLRYRNRDDSMSHTVADWPWHEWYTWGRKTTLTPWIAPVDHESEDPIIPIHEDCIVSIVVPVGPGHERLVFDAIDSIQGQTFRWWELILVNDTGSPLPWTPPWVTVVDTPGRVGAGAARNLGMYRTRGRLFLFLDADDYLQPRALELMVETFMKTGGFIYSDWYVQETGELKVAPEWDGCESVLTQLPWPVTCMYPRAAWEASGGFDEELPAWEDWDFAIRVVSAGYCGTRVAVPLFHYRIGSGQRREDGYASKDTLLPQIVQRWSQYITKEKPMPCGCGGGGGLPSLPAVDFGASAPTASMIQAETGAVDELVMVEFTDSVAAPLTYTGRSTGTRYKFGSDEGHRVRYVYKADAQHFLEREEFRLYNDMEGSKPLLAAGPPQR